MYYESGGDGEKDLLKIFVSKKFLLIMTMAIIALIFRNVIVGLVLIGATIGLSLLSSISKLRYFGLELVTFTVVLLGAAYGPVIGLVSGFVLETAHILLSRRVGYYDMWVIPSFGIAGFIAGSLSGISIVFLGVGLTLLLHGIHLTLSFLTAGAPAMKYNIYVLPNILLNVLLFVNFGAFVLRLL